MITVNLVQGSPEWLNFRLLKFTASDAPVVLGFSPYKTRTQLLDEKATGVVPAVSAQTQKLFDRGHAAEELARVITEKNLGLDLYPLTAYSEKNERIAASFDGVTMMEDFVFEHKLFSQKLIDKINELDDLPDTHWPQVEQQLYVCGAEKCLFVVSDGTEENRFEFMYYARAERQKMVLDAWAQFEADLVSHEVIIEEVLPVAQDRTTLPSVNVRVQGEVSIIDNFSAFGDALRDFIENKLVTDPQDDQDFADLEEQVKTLKKAEQALQDAERMIISSVDAIEQAQKQKDMLYSLARDNRLMAEKLVKAKKDEIRLKILNDANDEFADYIASLEAGLGKLKLPTINPNVADAMKGKRTIISLRDAASTAIARAKVEASGIASRMSLGREILAKKSEGYEFLFRDAAELVMKEAEALEAIIALRISEHKQAEEAKLEAERDRIRQEEERKAHADAERKAEAEREKIRAEEQAKAQEAARIEREAASQSEAKATAIQVESEEPARYITEPAKRKPAHEVVDAVCKYFDTDGETAKQIIIQAAIELNKTNEVNHG